MGSRSPAEIWKGTGWILRVCFGGSLPFLTQHPKLCWCLLLLELYSCSVFSLPPTTSVTKDGCNLFTLEEVPEKWDVNNFCQWCPHIPALWLSFFIIRLFLCSPSHLCETALAKALSQFCTNGILTVQIEKIEIRRHVFEWSLTCHPVNASSNRKKLWDSKSY